MKTLNYSINFAKRFKKTYTAKMGGSQTVILPNGQFFKFDDREYYSGRGSKYNSSIKHDVISDVIVSKKQVTEELKIDRKYKKELKLRIMKNEAKGKRILQAAKNGVYSLSTFDYGTFVELSEDESTGQFFDAKRLANTLKISEENAQLLNSKGKTYVFAKSEDGNTYELYHSSLSCNDLSISVNIATPERIAEFMPAEWQSAPYAKMLGQTNSNNHFVC